VQPTKWVTQNQRKPRR